MGAGAWVREYGVQVETGAADTGLEALLLTADATAITFPVSGIGVSGDGTLGGQFKLLLNNKPDIVSGSAIQETEVASGQADMTEEDLQTTVGQPVAFAPEIKANAYNVGLFMQLLVQSGYTELAIVGTTRVGKAIPYTIIDVTKYGAFLGAVAKLGGTKDECVLSRGGIASSVKLAAEEGGILTLTAEIMGATWSKSFNPGAPWTSQGTSPKVAFLKWQNATILIDDAYVTPADPTSGLKTLTDSTATRFYLQGFDLTMNNNAIAKFYNSANILSYALGKFKAEGNITVPWVVPSTGGATAIANKYYWDQINDFQQGIVKHLRISWGTWAGSDATATDNALVLDMYIKYRSGTLEGDDVLGSTLSFTCVQPTAATPSTTVRCGYAATGTNRTKRT